MIFLQKHGQVEMMSQVTVFCRHRTHCVFSERHFFLTGKLDPQRRRCENTQVNTSLMSAVQMQYGKGSSRVKCTFEDKKFPPCYLTFSNMVITWRCHDPIPAADTDDWFKVHISWHCGSDWQNTVPRRYRGGLTCLASWHFTQTSDVTVFTLAVCCHLMRLYRFEVRLCLRDIHTSVGQKIFVPVPSNLKMSS